MIRIEDLDPYARTIEVSMGNISYCLIIGGGSIMEFALLSHIMVTGE